MKALEMREKNLENETDFQLKPESRRFTEIISSIHCVAVDLFDPDVTLDDNLKHPDLIFYGISEGFLKLYLKNNYLPRIRQYCKKS